ncbi:MAG: phosphoribosylglycinamide formyltransferase [Phycisphaerales bacterium]|nr:phosphoribosylglycinamide formyltransferase [Phycisphaerales bacterium]
MLVMISGGGRTLMNLHERMAAGTMPGRVAGVVASRPCPGEQWARGQGLATRVIGGVIGGDELGRIAGEFGAEWIVLAGYLRLVRIPGGLAGRVVNIHPALLPAFGGPGMYGDRVHRAVIEAGCRVSGCTVHLCDDRFDTGPIVAQRCCEVLDTDTPATLAARVFEIEKALYPDALTRLMTRPWTVLGRRLIWDGA